MDRFGRLAVVLVFGLLVAACSGGARPAFDDEQSTDDDSFQPQIGDAPTPTPLPDCPADVVDRDTTWPYTVDPAVAPTEYLIDDLQYVVRGITNDPEAVLVNTMEGAFPGYEVGEPEGETTDILVDFTSDLGTASLFMADDDGDNCWDVELTADYIATPSAAADPGGATGDGTGDDDTGADDAIDVGDPENDDEAADGTNDQVDPLDQVESVGVGEIITARGTFQLAVTTCGFDPVGIEAIAENGELFVEPGEEEGSVAVTWTYDDGVVITDAAGRILQLGDATGTFVADGVNEEGPETLLIELTC